MKLSNELKLDDAFEHIVPLAEEAVAVLKSAHLWRDIQGESSATIRMRS